MTRAVIDLPFMRRAVDPVQEIVCVAERHGPSAA